MRFSLSSTPVFVRAVLHKEFVGPKSDKLLEDQTIVRATLQRLMEAGLTRHETIHAIGSVLTEHIYDLLHTKTFPAEGHAPYYAALQQLTVEKWRGG